ADVGSDGLTKIILSTSADAGETFSAPQNLTADGVDAREPVLAVSPNTGSLYMVWRAHGTPYGATVGFLSKSTDFGATWSTPRLVAPGVTRGRQFSVAAVDPNVYVTYMRHNQANDYWRPQVLVSHNGAMSFGATISLGNSGLTGMLKTEEHAPRLWANDTRLRVVYDVRGKLFMSASVNSGASFGPRIALGRGASALVTQNTALWLADNGSVRFAI
ncbi:MAG: sialidase family protein, partial [Stellaceae bacterium]